MVRFASHSRMSQYLPPGSLARVQRIDRYIFNFSLLVQSTYKLSTTTNPEHLLENNTIINVPSNDAFIEIFETVTISDSLFDAYLRDQGL